MKISQKVLLALLLSSNSFAQDCKPSLYQYRDEHLCFSGKLKSYLTQNCADDKCEALDLVEKAKNFDFSKLTSADSRHQGAKTCQALGGQTSVVTSEKTKDQLCLCIAKDQSGVSCSRLGLH